MKVKIVPSVCQGEVQIPPSKSIAHRAIICASLAQGESMIHNVDYSIDIRTTIEGMRALGASIIEKESTLIIQGIQNFNQINQHEIGCNESGSTLRFFIPLFSLTNREISFLGKNRLMQRPQSVYQDIFAKQGLTYFHRGDIIKINGAIQSGIFEFPGNISSQFISGLLFALPLVEGDSKIIIEPPFESKSYVDLTLATLAQYQINAYFKDDHTIIIPGGQHYQPCEYHVEGDFSQLGFFAALAMINHDLCCVGMNHQSLQGDREIISILQAMNGQVTEIAGGYLFRKSKLQASRIDLANCPDLGPILMVMAAFAEGKTTIYNAGRLRYKESDRIAAMEQELRKMGVTVESTQDEIKVYGVGEFICDQPLSGHDDHRIVMSLAIAATIANQPCTITQAQAIDKSYPNFFTDLESLGIKVEYENE